MKKIVCIIVVVLISNLSYTQTSTIYPINSTPGQTYYLSLVGDATPALNETTRYYYRINGTTSYLSFSSVVIYGAQVISSNYQYIEVKWTSTGRKQLNVVNPVYSGTAVSGTAFYIDVSGNIPATPTPPTVLSNNCGNTVLQRGNPPSGVTWYWQTSANGINTYYNSYSTITVSSGSTYYLRARSSDGTWSTNSSSVNYTVNTLKDWYQDQDNDDFGDPNSTMSACSQPTGYVSNANDQCPTVYGTDFGCPVTAPNTNENYIQTTNYQVATTSGVYSSSGITLTNDDKIESITYYDDLGRPKQAITKQAGGSRQDIIKPIVYDALGRQTKDYLPYANASQSPLAASLDFRNTNALISTINTYYSNKFPEDIEASAPNPYSEKIYEASPLNKILEQAAPGKDWKANATSDTDHTIKTVYLTNTFNASNPNDPNNDNVVHFSVVHPDNDSEKTELQVIGYYKAGALSKTITKDENWQPRDGKNHTTEEFKDKLGLVVLVRTYNNSIPHDTYSVYDKFGNLTYVIPPLASSENALANGSIESDVHTNAVITSGSTTNLKAANSITLVPDFHAQLGSTFSAIIDTNGLVRNNIINGLCYIYHYDKRNRLIEKKIPGKDWEYIVYDNLDKPLLVQDPNLKAQNKWLFTKTDVFDRVLYTGLYTYSPLGSDTNAARVELQQTVDAQTNPTWNESKLSGTTSNLGISYTNAAFPNAVANIELLTVSYYDDYSGFDNMGLLLSSGTAVFDDTITSNTKTLPTASRVKVLGTTDWITTIMQYDDKARPIYIATKNSYLNTTDTVKNDLDFTGKTITTKTSHSKDAHTPIVTLNTFSYDHTGRVLTQSQTINGGTAELITNITYDELGQVETKKVGGDMAASPENSSGLQTIDYTFNIRGWLKQINDPNGLGSDLFGFKINYNTTNIATTPKLYNGNISETHWKTVNDNQLRHYNYRYDALNRLTEANYSGGILSFLDNVTQPVNQNENYSLKAISYDKNGNINHLERYGIHRVSSGTGNNTTTAIVDGLDYSYEAYTNKLVNVNDFADTASQGQGGFLETYTDGNKYEYDTNGNLIKDHNKSISSITYNHLNLPVKVVFNGNDPLISTTWEAIEYVYDATGTKLEKTIKRGSTGSHHIEKTKYANHYIYEETTSRPEVLKFFSHPEGYIEPTGTSGYRYVYQFKDHLNNVRLSYSDIDNSNTIDITEIVEENNYYPFGLQHKGYNNVINGTEHPYTYNGKEEQNELGLNWHDFGARNYDVALGRWMNLDPLGEMTPTVSPYTYVLNNPVLFTDPDGMRVVAESQEAQDLITNMLSELLGENHGFYFNRKGVLKHRGGRDHRNAKEGYSDEQNAIFDGFTEIASNEDYTIDVFQQEGSDREYSAEFRNQDFVTNEDGTIKMENGAPVLREDGTTTIVDVTNQTEGETGGGVFLIKTGHKNAVSIIFPDVAATRSFKAADGKFTIGSMSATVVHELLDHGVDFIRTGNNQNSSGPSIQNVDYQNKALIIIGSPTRVKHNHE